MESIASELGTRIWNVWIRDYHCRYQQSFSRRVIADAERDSITVLLTGGAILGRALLHYCCIDGVLACACVIDIRAAAFVEGLRIAVLL